MFSIHGLQVVGGVAIGRARVLESGFAEIARYHVEGADRAFEVRRLHSALESVRGEIAQLARHLPADAPSEARALLEVHELMLDDPMLIEAAERRVMAENVNAEWALASQTDELAQQFAQLEDAYLAERANDVVQVAARVLRVLSGSAEPRPNATLADTIVVAADLSPSDLLNFRDAAGFAVGMGGAVSHTAILARSLNKPAVIGLGEAVRLVRSHDWVVLDGEAGVLLVGPDETVLEAYRVRQQAHREATSRLRVLINVPPRTRDGVAVDLHANVDLPAEAHEARLLGADGIGLFRSEFLFLKRNELPGEDEQFEAYREAIVAMRGRPVTIRTLDVGADKALPSRSRDLVPNPALGQRAIRFCLAEPVIFLTQLRAMLRASRYGKLRILIPMLAHMQEVTQTRELLERAKEQLRERGEHFDEAVPLGGMVEVPAAALASPWFARNLDFLSIGTNDLVQYTLAIDRGDQAVASLYDPLHPAVLRLIALTVRAGRRYGKPVAVCGEMAGVPEYLGLLLGLGLRQLSMHPANLLRLKETLLATDSADTVPIARAALAGMGGTPDFSGIFTQAPI